MSERSLHITLGLLGLGVVMLLVARRPHPMPQVDLMGPPAASRVDDPAAASSRLAEAMTEIRTLPLESRPGKWMDALDEVHASQIGQRMPDGSVVPPLPISAPRRVRFGVILIRYRGAQLARTDTPSREQALLRAQQIALIAQTDFVKGVTQGDDGSAVDVGRVTRNILEPFLEHTLFLLPPGQVAGPIDTPRGFWIVRRID